MAMKSYNSRITLDACYTYVYNYGVIRGCRVVRTQIILKEGQKRELEKLAHEQARSVSEVVREMIDAQLRLDRDRQLKDAAEKLRDDYLSDPELTAFSAIEGGAFHEEG
jgi:hypothetical protein